MRKRTWSRKIPARKKKPITIKEKTEKKERRLILQALTKRRKSATEKVRPFPLIKISYR